MNPSKPEPKPEPKPCTIGRPEQRSRLERRADGSNVLRISPARAKLAGRAKLTPEAQAQLDNVRDMMTWPEIRQTPRAVARLAKIACSLRKS